jgi:hypothetical protein
MPSNRTPLRRARREPLTPEMVALYRRGCELKRRKRGKESDEFIAIDKKLNWGLLGRDPHQVSVFANLRGDPPAYMQARDSPAWPDFNGWRSGQESQRRLQAAVRAMEANVESDDDLR